MRLSHREIRARRIWFVRHGESTWNASGIVQGHSAGPVLTDLGLRQAALVGRQLARKPIGGIVSSDLTRSLQTARPLAERVGLAIRVEPGFRERALGEAEGRPSAELTDAWSGIAGGRIVDADARPPGGESTREFYGRVLAAMATVLTGMEGNLVIFCHGGVLRLARAVIEGVAPDDLPWGPLGNGAVLAYSVSAHQQGSLVSPMSLG